MNQNTLKKQLRDRYRRERVQKFIPTNFNVILKAPEIVSATQFGHTFHMAKDPAQMKSTKLSWQMAKDFYSPESMD